MAAGSHLENGVCALFVIAANIIDKMIITSSLVCHILMIIQLFEIRQSAIDVKINASPSRFVIAVIIPAPSDFGFW
jgi:hypothetical protein